MAVAVNSYLLASAAIGMAQIADAVLLTKRLDRGFLGALTLLFSFCEYVWAGVSLLVLRNAAESFPSWLPASFVAYVALFFVGGLVVAVRSKGERSDVPRSMAVAGGWFGVYFAAASLLQWSDV